MINKKYSNKLCILSNCKKNYNNLVLINKHYNKQGKHCSKKWIPSINYKLAY